MANTLLTNDIITRESLRLFRNTHSFIQHVDRQYDDSFAQVGAKIGDSLRIRLPNDYTVRTGAAAQPQDTVEQNTTLTVATQMGVDLAFTSRDRTMKLDDFSKRILAPAINNLIDKISSTVLSGAPVGTDNFVANTDVGGNILAPNAGTWLSAGALLTTRQAPNGMRLAALHPFTMAKTVSSLSGLFNPAPRISEQYEDANIKSALNLTWFEDQQIPQRTSGAFTTGTVNGASQTGLTLTVNAIGAALNAGDIITISGVNMVNRTAKDDTGILMQFVVTAAAGAGATSLSIYPAIVPPVTVGGTSTNVQYQTVTASPANGATITLVQPSSTTYRQNLVFVPEAVVLATADLELPEGVAMAARETVDSISMRMISAYDIRTDIFFSRLDVLFGYLWIRPEWVVCVGDNTAFS